MSFSRETFENLHSKLISNKAPDIQVLEQLAIMNFSSNKNECKLVLESLEKFVNIDPVDPRLRSSIVKCFENCAKYIKFAPSILAMLPFIYQGVYSENEALRKQAIQILRSIVNNERYDSTEDLRKEIFKICNVYMPRMVATHDPKYLETFELTLELLGKRLNIDIPILNGMLKLEQDALLSRDGAFRIQALIAWKKVIDTFSLYHQVFENPKRIALVMKPLLRPGGDNLEIINAKIDVWLHLLSKFNLEILLFESTVVGMCNYIVSLAHFPGLMNRFVSIFTKMICGSDPRVPVISDDLFIKNYPKMFSYFEVSIKKDVDSDLKEGIICSFIKRLVTIGGSEELDYTTKSNGLQKSEIKDICFTLGRDAQFIDFAKKSRGNNFLQRLLDYLLDVLIDMDTIAKWNELVDFAMISVQCNNKPYSVIQLLLQKMKIFCGSSPKSDLWMLIAKIAINYVTCTESCNQGREFDPSFEAMKEILIEPFMIFQKLNKEDISVLLLKKSALRELWNQLYRLIISTIDLEVVASSESFRIRFFNKVLTDFVEDNSLYGSFLLSSLEIAYSEVSCGKPSKEELIILYKLLNRAASCDLDKDDCKSFITFMKSLMKILSRDSIYPELIGNCVKELNLAGHEGTLNVAKRKKILKNNKAVLIDDEEELKKWKSTEEKMKGRKALEPSTNPKSAKKSTIISAGKASETEQNTSASTATASSSSKTPVKYNKEKDKASQEVTIQRSSKKQVNKGPSRKIEESPFRSSKELNQPPKETNDVSSKGNHIQTVGKNLSVIEDKSDVTTPRTHSSKTPIKSSKKKDKAPKETDGVSSKGNHIQLVGKNMSESEDNSVVSAPRTHSSKTPLKSSKKKDEALKEINDVSGNGNHIQTVGMSLSGIENNSDVNKARTHSSKTPNKSSKKKDESPKEIKDASGQVKNINGKNVSEIEDDADIKTPQTQSSKTPIRSSKKKDESPKEIKDTSSQGKNIQAVGKNVSEIEGVADIKTPQTQSSKTPTRSNKKKDEEFVVIPSTPRSRVLTERQKEKLKEQKRDIPAMYNDYSQDSMLIATNSSQSQSLLSECKSVTNSSAFPKIETSENKSTQKSITKNGANSNDRRQSKRRKIEFPVEQLEENAVSSPFKVDFVTNAPSDQLPAFNLNDAKCVRFESPSGTKVAVTTDDDEFVPRKRKFVPTPFKITPANGSKLEESKNVSLQDGDEIHNLSALFKSPIRNSPTAQVDQKKREDLNDSDAVIQMKKGKIVCLEIEGKENSIFKEPLVDQQISVLSMENEESHALDSPLESGGKYSENGKRSKKRDRKSELPLRSLRSAAISSPNSPTSPDLLTNTKTKIKPAVVLSSSRRGRPKKYVDTPRPVIVSTKISGGNFSAKVKTIKGNDPAKSIVSNISKEDSSPKMEELKKDNIAEITSQKTTKVMHDSPELNLNQLSEPCEYDSADELILKDRHKIKKKYPKTTKTKNKNQSPTLGNCVEVNKVKYPDVPKSPEEQSECEVKILKPAFSVNDGMGEEKSERRPGDEEQEEQCLDGYASEPGPRICEKSQSDDGSPVRSVKRNNEIITIDEFETTTRDVSEVCEENILCPEVLSNASSPSPTECAAVHEHTEVNVVSDCESESSLPLSVLQLRCRTRKESEALLKYNDESNEHENMHSYSSKIYSEEDLPICSVTDVKSLSSVVALDNSDLPSPGAVSVSESAEKSGYSADSSEGQETLVPSKLDDSYILNGESVSYSVMSVIDSKKLQVIVSRLEEGTNIEPEQATESGGAPESVDLFSEPSLRVSPRRTPRKSPSKPYDKDIADTVKCSLKFEGSPQKSSGPSPSSEKKAEKITATHLTPYKQSKLGRMPSLSGRSAQLVVLAQAKGKQMEKEIQDAKKLSPAIPEQPEVQNNGGDSKPQSPAKPWKRHSYSPNASPSSSILKRKLSDEDNTTPPSKSRKVTFRTPEVSDQVQVPRKDEEKDSYPRLRRRSLGKQLSVASDEEPVGISPEKPSLVATAEQLEETLPVQVTSSSPFESVTSSPLHLPTSQDEIIFPELMDCTDEVGRLTCVLASGPWVKMLNRKLKERNIITVGQLCSLPPSEIEKLDIQPPKIPKAKSAMQKFYLEWKKCVVKQAPNLAKPKLVDSQVEAEESSPVAATPQLPVDITEDTAPSQDNSEMNAKSIGGNSQNCLSTRTVLSDVSVTELNEDKAELISVFTQTDNTGTIDDEYFQLDDQAKAALRTVISHMRKLMEKPSSS